MFGQGDLLTEISLTFLIQRKVLGSLSHLRLDKTRIEAIGSQAPKAGGKADVEAAVLTSVPPSGSSEDQAPEYVAVKKLRFDSETDDDQALAVSPHGCPLIARANLRLLRLLLSHSLTKSVF